MSSIIVFAEFNSDNEFCHVWLWKISQLILRKENELNSEYKYDDLHNTVMTLSSYYYVKS